VPFPRVAPPGQAATGTATLVRRSASAQAAYGSAPALAARALPLGDTLQTLFAALVAGLPARRERGLSATVPSAWTAQGS